MTGQHPYSMVIQWSDEDEVYVVHLPEFGPGAKTHGETYEEAAKAGHEVIEMLIEAYGARKEELPDPHIFGTALPRRAGKPAVRRKKNSRSTLQHAS